MRQTGQETWIYEFMPQDWRPVAGRYTVQVWRDESGGPPLLATIDAEH